MLQEDAACLPAHVTTILSAVAAALGDKALLPENLHTAVHESGPVLEGHNFHIVHEPRPPKGAKPRLKARYILRVVGPRIDGQWSFSPGQLAELLNNLRKAHS